MKIEAIIQARMGSARLPGKVLTDLQGRPVLWHVIERVKQSRGINDVLVATSDQKADDRISEYLGTIGVRCFRGDEEDVLSRYYHAVKRYPADAVVRITADCPLIDPHLIDEVVALFLHSSCQYASNTGEERKTPRGLDCEIFTRDLLRRAYREAEEVYEREHVTPFMYLKQDKIAKLRPSTDNSDLRLTLDTREDLSLIREIYRHFFRGRHDFYTDEIVSFLRDNPNILELNCNIRQKELKDRHESRG